jgi:hypothetical protein
LSSVGYIYGFTPDEVRLGKEFLLDQRMRSIVDCAKAEFEKWKIENAANQSSSKPDIRPVHVRWALVNERTPETFKALKKKFPDFALFAITPRNTHELLRRDGHFRFLEEIQLETLPGGAAVTPDQLEFLAVVQPTNTHLWLQ